MSKKIKSMAPEPSASSWFFYNERNWKLQGISMFQQYFANSPSIDVGTQRRAGSTIEGGQRKHADDNLELNKKPKITIMLIQLLDFHSL